MKNSIKEKIKKSYNMKSFQKDPTGYFYDLDEISNNIKNLEDNLPKQISLYYAMKANSNKYIMNYINKFNYVKGIEIASFGELKYALNYKNNKNIIFTGPGKTELELTEAVKNKIRYINVESIVEAIRIDNIANKLKINNVNILLRINSNYSLNEGTEKMSGCSTKMGIDEKYINDAIKIIFNLKHITIKGIHVFCASGVLEYKELIKSNKYVFDLVKSIEENNKINIEVIDFGGGIGIDYSNNNIIFNIKEYGIELKKLINEYNLQEKEIIMELGTYLVGNCGYYTAKIVDIKETKDYKHIILAGGVNHMGLPLEMRRKHPIEIINCHEKKLYDKQFNIRNEYADISGPLCMVSDKISWNDLIPAADIGDIVVFKQSGAYCYGEGMQKFLMHFPPKEIILGDKNDN